MFLWDGIINSRFLNLVWPHPCRVIVLSYKLELDTLAHLTCSSKTWIWTSIPDYGPEKLYVSQVGLRTEMGVWEHEDPGTLQWGWCVCADSRDMDYYLDHALAPISWVLFGGRFEPIKWLMISTRKMRISIWENLEITNIKCKKSKIEDKF